ncbi:MAG: F0F1 ATP synthase subunit A [Ilumatobacteraceae bacterium]
MLGLDFPPINEVIRWRDFFGSFNKIALLACAAAIIGTVVFLIAGRKDPMKAPKGIRNLAETIVEFIEGIVMQTIGKEGLVWTPWLLSLFVFVYLCNVPGIIPILQMPVTARMALPLFLAIVVWVVYNAVGLRHQKGRYITHMLWPPGVPVAMKPLVGLIEFVSNIVLRPFSLAIRLFANMLAGHMLLVTFALLSEAMFLAETHKIFLVPMGILPMFMLIFLTAFEVLVGFLQAYIFTILTCVFIGQSRHSEHAEAH